MHILVLKYTRNISILKMFCDFANSSKNELKKSKNTKTLQLTELIFKNGVIHVKFFCFLNIKCVELFLLFFNRI